MPLGYEVFRQINRPDPSLLEKFHDVAAADLGDVVYKRGAMDTGIKPIYTPIAPAIGPAVTVSAPDCAFEMIKIAMEMTQPGDVLVINTGGNTQFALMGDNVCRGLKARGLAGIVVDGAVRDVSAIQEDGLPVYARGAALIMGPIEGAGEVNVPIACGGVVVNPGDIVVATQDGIIVIPPDRAEETLEKAHKLHAGHMAVQPVLLRGEVTNIANILARAEERGATFHDASYPVNGATGANGARG